MMSSSAGSADAMLMESIATMAYSTISSGMMNNYSLEDVDSWLNLSITNLSYPLSPTATNSTVENSSGLWEAGKVRIPLYSIIFLLGIAGNGLVILTILQNSRMRTVTNLFLLNLAIADLLLGVFCIPFTLVGALLRDFVFGEVFCKLIPFLQAVSVSVSGWTLVAISVERFYAICHPLTSRKWQTRSHARYIILAVWLASLTIMSPVAVLSELKPLKDGRRKCREVWPDETLEKVFTVFLDVVLLIIPLLIMGVMYGLIVNHLWKVDQGAGGGDDGVSSRGNISSARIGDAAAAGGTAVSTLNGGQSLNGSTLTPGNRMMTYRTNNKLPTVSGRMNPSSGVGPTAAVVSMAQPSLRRCNPEHCLKTKRRVLKMLIVVVLEFFICWTPLYVVNTLSFFAPKALYEGLGYTGISLLQLLAQASCCCNPITYCFMSSSFRRAFLKAFGCSKDVNSANVSRSVV